MSVDLFRQRLSRSQVHPNDIKWMPKWLEEFACQQADPAAGMFTFDTGIVTRFLQSLRDRGAPAWQRLQAVRTLEWYQMLLHDSMEVDFGPFKAKLAERAELGVDLKPGRETLSLAFPGSGMRQAFRWRPAFTKALTASATI